MYHVPDSALAFSWHLIHAYGSEATNACIRLFTKNLINATCEKRMRNSTNHEQCHNQVGGWHVSWKAVRVTAVP